MTRTEARKVAEELYKLIHKDVKNIVSQTVKEETEEWIGAKEAAKVLGWSVGTLYNRIEEIPHTKLNNRLRFKKSALLQYLNR